MKALPAFLLISCVLVNCKTPNAAEENVKQDTALTSPESSAPVVSNVAGRISSPWIIPLSDYWKDPASFVLAIPDSAAEMDFLVEPRFPRWEETTADTLQGKILQTQDASTRNECAHFNFHEVETDQNEKRGWLVDNQVNRVQQIDLGSYAFGNRELKLGAMQSKLMMEEGDETCYTVTMLFLYDSSDLYLIDASTAGPDMRWARQRHLSVVSQVAVSPTGTTEGDEFAIRWGEPNVTVELRIKWDLDHLKFISNVTTPLDSDVADL